MKRLKIMPVVCVPDHAEHFGSLEQAVRSFLQSLREFMVSRNVRLALYLPGAFLEACIRYCPKDIAWLRDQIRDGMVEPLGGGFHEALFPLFPRSLQTAQLRRHRDLLRSSLASYPQGWYCPSKCWEVGLLHTIAGMEFEYTILDELAFADVLSQPLPIGGWRTMEDSGKVLRVFPASFALSTAWSSGDASALLAAIGELPETDSGWLLEVSAFPKGWQTTDCPFLRTLGEVLDSASSVQLEIQTWTPTRILEQSRPAGHINLISTMGTGLGLHTGLHTCRELLNRRPESNFIHKRILYLHQRALQVLSATEAQAVDSLLLPLMAARYYRNLPSPQGIRGLANRVEAHRQLIEVDKALDRLSERNLRLEVLDFLGDGSPQILASTQELGFLLDHQRGGILHSLDFKSMGFNWITGQLDDGTPSVALRDHLISQDRRTLGEILGTVEDRSGELVSPYDYQIKRQSDRVQLVLTAEQGVPVDGRAHSLRVVKVVGFKHEGSELQFSWQLTNGTFQVARSQFATDCVISFPEENRRKQTLVLDGKRLSWSDIPCVRSTIQNLVFLDRSLGARLQLEFLKPVTLVVTPVLGSSTGAAPEDFQGMRLIFLWDLELKGQESTAFHMRMRMDKRRLIF